MTDETKPPKPGLRRGSSARSAGSAAGLRAAVAAGREEVEAGKAATVTPIAPAAAGKPVRVSLDLERPQHRFVQGFAQAADPEVKVDISDVLRVLVLELEKDEALAERVKPQAVAAALAKKEARSAKLRR
jgi:hypothetical protein